MTNPSDPMTPEKCACQGSLPPEGRHGANECEYEEPDDQREDECDIEAFNRRRGVTP